MGRHVSAGQGTQAGRHGEGEPSGVQTAYIAPATKALDWCIKLLGNGHRVEVWDNTGAKIAPAELVHRAAQG